MLHGCDLSRWNKTPSFDGIDFVFARASIGVYVDDSAERHLMAARSQSVPALGCYGFLRGDADGGEQARVLLTREAILGGGMMLAIDVEDLPAHLGPPWDKKRYAAVLANAAQAIRDVGRIVGVYGSTFYLAGMMTANPLAMQAIAAVCPLWVADWTPPWDVPPPWKAWTLLQTGASKGVDQDEAETTIEELRATFGIDDAARGCVLPGP